MVKLILASASPRRLELLEQINITPDAIVPAEIDETPHPREKPERYVLRVACEKARKVATEYPEAVVLAADTIVICNSKLLGKAESPEQVHNFLTQLSGRTHRVLSAIYIIGANEQKTFKLVETKVIFKRLSPKEITTYVASNEGIGKAGGYAIQGLATAFVVRLHGSYTNVVGLPLYETRNALISMGAA